MLITFMTHGTRSHTRMKAKIILCLFTYIHNGEKVARLDDWP